jgi:hypothetical protein
MSPSQATAKGKNSILVALPAVILLAAGCAASAASHKSPVAVPPPDPPAVTKAREEFLRGREAALSGDFDCAAEAFGRAIESVRPAGAEAPVDPEMIAFSTELYEGILRYEAMAPPVETEAREMAARNPMLSPPVPPDATPDELMKARQAVSTDNGNVTYDIPIVVNDSVLKILAVYQNDLHDVIARGLGRSGRFVPMIERVFQEEGLPGPRAGGDGRVLLHSARPLAQGGLRDLAVHPRDRPALRVELQRVCRREKRPGEGDARGGAVSPVPLRPLPRLVPRHGRLQRRRREDSPDDGEDRADGLLAARRLGPPETADAELRAGRHRLHADREEPGPLRFRGRVREAAPTRLSGSTARSA